MTSPSPDLPDDPMPDWALDRVLETLEPHRADLEPLLRAAAPPDPDQ